MNEHALEVASSAPADTHRLGRAIGKLLCAGDWIGLNGDLGAGKTRLTQGLADGLGVAPDIAVTSPTFVILQTYPGRVPLHHLDLYRLSEYEELVDVGYEDLISSGGICVVEWADRIPASMPSDGLLITISLRSETERTLRLYALGPRGQSLIAELAA